MIDKEKAPADGNPTEALNLIAARSPINQDAQLLLNARSSRAFDKARYTVLENNVNAFKTCNLDAVSGMPKRNIASNAVGDCRIEGAHPHAKPPQTIPHHPQYD